MVNAALYFGYIQQFPVAPWHTFITESKIDEFSRLAKKQQQGPSRTEGRNEPEHFCIVTVLFH